MTRSRVMRIGLLLSLFLSAIFFAHAETAAVTSERIALLPTGMQLAWREYLSRSHEEMAADRNAIYAELEGARMIDWSAPRDGEGVAKFLKMPDAWFAGEEARRITNIVCSFQTPSGGWGKGIDLETRSREPGERFSSGASGWAYAGTFDNGATVAEIRFLARASAAQETARAALRRGLDFVLRAQFPNGGWPQVYPLMGGYHDAITFNDDAMVNVLRLLRDVADKRAEFANVDTEMGGRAASAVGRGVACIVVTQSYETVWGQQHDALTLAPAPARAFEMVALASAESVGIVRFLMEIDEPSPAVVAAVHHAARWLRAVAIEDGKTTWARYYEIGTDRPLFGDRDGSIHYDIREISDERRKGYAWFSSGPSGALSKYEKWAAKHPVIP